MAIADTLNNAYKRALEAVNLTTKAEAEAYAAQVYREAMNEADVLHDEPPSGDIANYGYTYMSSSGTRRLERSNDDINKTVWALHESNAVAKRAMEIKRDYILGHSFQITTDDEPLREIYDTFKRVNKFGLRLKNFVHDGFLFGEICLPVFVRESDGQTRLGYIDPSDIQEVVTHPQNVLERWIVVCKTRTIDETPRIYRIIREDEATIIAGSVIEPKNPEKLVAATQTELQLWERAFLSEYKKEAYTGSCFYLGLNNVTAQARGVSDLMQPADTLDQLDETLFSLGERESLAGYFSWDVELIGADEAKVRARAKEIAKNPPTKKGQANVHNDSEKWTMNYPDIQAPASIATADALKAHATSGVGQPAHWHNLDNTATRTTADSQNNPTWKTLEHDQSIIKAFIVEIFDFVRDQAEIAGFWKPTNDIEHDVIVTLPEVAERDTSRASQTLATATQALSVAMLDLKVIGRETAAKVVAKLIGELGIDYDAIEELQTIDDMPEVDDNITETIQQYLNGNDSEIWQP